MDADRLTELYRRYGPAIYARCRTMLSDESAAEDATQETFLRVQRHLDRVPSAREALYWIYRVATNYCLNELRSRRSRALPHAELADLLRKRELQLRAQPVRRYRPSDLGVRRLSPLPAALWTGVRQHPACMPLWRSAMQLPQWSLELRWAGLSSAGVGPRLHRRALRGILCVQLFHDPRVLHLPIAERGGPRRLPQVHLPGSGARERKLLRFSGRGHLLVQ